MKPATVFAMVAAIIGISISFIAVTTVSNGGMIPIIMMLAFMGFMFFFVFKYLIRPAMNAFRLRKNGLPGTARILSVKDTGMTINNSPVVKLEVEIKDSFGQRYTTSILNLVSRINPQVYSPGMEVAVKIDPKKKENAIIDDDKTGITNNPAVEGLNKTTDWEQNQLETANILRSGHPARAIIKKYTWAGTYANGNDPVADLELEVIPELFPAFSGKTRAIIPEDGVHLYQPGAEVKVKYDLYDSSKIVIDPN